MTDNDRNVRTLIVCFALAVVSLVSLKFVEVSQNMPSGYNRQVLGVMNQKKRVVLPNAEIKPEVLQATYVGH